MKLSRSNVLQALAFTLATLAATAVLVAAGLSDEANAGSQANCLFCIGS